MKERPILMTPDNAQKTYEDLKLQTRRVVKPLPGICQACLGESVPHNREQLVYDDGMPNTAGALFGTDPYLRIPACEHGESVCGGRVRCPYGIPGDRLWIRHTVWMMMPVEDWEPHCWNPLTKTVIWKAGGEGSEETIDERKWKKVPAIHMPRWACRTVVELTAVRVERVQDISEADARAEGCQVPKTIWPDSPREAYSYVEQFKQLWTSIHGIDNPKAWERNPWCWVLTFRKVSL